MKIIALKDYDSQKALGHRTLILRGMSCAQITDAHTL